MGYATVSTSTLIAACFLLSSIAHGVSAAAAGVSHREETIATTVPYKTASGELAAVRISGALWVPNEGAVPHPLAIYSHGSQSATGAGSYAVEPKQFAAFLERGYAVFAPMRKGFNRAGTPLSQAKANETEPFACAGAEAGVQSAVSDSKALIIALIAARRADVDVKNITLFGHSRGGLLSVAIAANGLVGVKKVINFSGGWQTDCLDFNTAKFAEFAEKIKVPIFSFYGAYDSAWGVSHMKANLAALEKNGKGKGHILSGAGHNVFETHVQQWAPIVFGK